MAFINAYPRSWLLAEAYDIASRASINLGAYDRALKEGRFSLRLKPENGTLLVLMANLEARRRLYSQAETIAREALADLDQFAGPGNVSEHKWKSLKSRLKASAYFAIGRAYAARGLNAQPPDRKLLLRAVTALNQATASNTKNFEAFYLRALVELQLGEANRAAGDLAWVVRGKDPLSPKAEDRLRSLYPPAEFKKLIAHPPKPYITGKLEKETDSQEPSRAIKAGYAGSTACRPCHTMEYDTWRLTGMSKMLRAYKPQNIMGDLSAGTVCKSPGGKVLIRMGRDSRPYFDVAGSHGRWERFHVYYTIGSKWQQDT